MARDYKREYQVRKQRAQRAGYSGTREYGKARAGLPRNVSPLPKVAKTYAESSERRRAYAWSHAHSHSARSRYSHTMSDEQVRAYLEAYDTSWGKTKRSKAQRMKALKAYLRGWSDVDPGMWDEMYEEK